jgi:hypothetical protein
MLQHKLPPRFASKWNRVADVALLTVTVLAATRAARTVRRVSCAP